MLVGLILMVAAGCMKSSADVTVHDDQHVTMVLDIVPDRESWAGGRSGTDIDAAVDRTVEGIQRIAPQGIEVERVDTDHSAGLRLTWADATPQQLVAPMRFGTEANAATLRLFQSFDLAVDGDVWNLRAVVAPIDDSTRLATSGLVDHVAGAQITLRVQMPGRVTSTNAMERTRSSATWTIDKSMDQPTPIMMRTEPGLGLNPAWYAVAGALMLMVVGTLFMVAADGAGVRRRLRRRAAAATGTAGWDKSAASAATKGAHARRRSGKGSRARRARASAKGTGAGRDGGTDRSTPRGTYQDLTGDDSVSLPVGGQSWGPAPAAVDGSISDSTTQEAAEDVGTADLTAFEVLGTADLTVASTPEQVPDVPLSLTPPPFPGMSAVGIATGAGGDIAVAAGAADRAGIEAESSAAASTTTTSDAPAVVAPGWYPDPFGDGSERFWDGASWSDHHR